MDKIEVTQDDKYAAASLMSDVGLFSNVLTAKAVQAFARHRLATRTDATPVAWMYQSHVGTYPRIHRKQQTERYKVGWTETPLYTHPPATDVAALVDALREAREALHFHYVEWDAARIATSTDVTPVSTLAALKDRTHG